jgi:GxxExxY protein
MIEIKACSELLAVHFAQDINYLEASQFEIGLLINFGSEKLQIKRLYNNKRAKIERI